MVRFRCMFAAKCSCFNPLAARLFNLNLFRFDKTEVNSLQILLVDVTFYLQHFQNVVLMC